MTFAKTTKGLLLGLALLLATSAFASNKGTIELLNSVNIGGTQVAPGNYSLKWDGNGPNVQVSILKGAKVVATTQARVVDMNQSSNSDMALVTSNPDGTKTLSQIQLAGKKFALQIGQEGASEAGGSK